METIDLYIIWGIAALALIALFFYWITKPDKCPHCGSRMSFESWTDGNGKEISSLRCYKCGYEEILNVEK